ncbi:cache domain-containing protein [Naasia sp. SYSU D00057]|uniref:cache domain-containing protein n=1 Tax=Naasia sp. SYSU D00057 TaxID=2817380 RepID=UPI001B309389|nr:cache domain-containing protein [Naasia sp. SYSU D00057]
MTTQLIGSRADAVAAVFAPVLRLLEGWRHPLAAALAAGAGERSALLDPAVERLVTPALSDRSTLVVGAGFIAAPGLLGDVPLHLAWWLGKFNTLGAPPAEAQVRRLPAVEDPSSEDFHDYTFMEWWRVPAETRLPHLTGPYVDYLCTDDYTLTLTVPVTRGDELLGLLGADLYVREIEAALLPALTGAPGVLTLVNRSGRVILSTDPHRPSGVLLRNAAGSGATALPVEWGGTPLTLVAEA